MIENYQLFLKEKVGLSNLDIQTLTASLSSKTYRKGDFLLHAGEVCAYAFFVEKGLLRSFTTDETGKEHIIQFGPENWFVTDRSSSYFNEPSDFAIEAVEDTTVVLIDAAFISRASANYPSFMSFNEKALQNHIRQLQKRINLLLSATAEKRYLEFVRLYPDLTLRVPQWMIASYLGITPESLSRVRKELAKNNFKPH
ncbi:MAG: fnr [Cytophagaceae bacterium]|jgi:CRP-like cAMP-binding protein|nr:fnr [Cytophagaceae bacterium]